MLLNKLLISILQGADLSKKDFKQCINQQLDNPFSRQNMTGVGDIWKILPFVTCTGKKQIKNTLITSGYSEPMITFFSDYTCF